MGRTVDVPRIGGHWAGRRLLVAGLLAALFVLAGAGLAADWLAGRAAPAPARAPGTASIAGTAQPDPTSATASIAGASQADAATRARALRAYGRLPLTFEANRGQQPAGIRYLARSATGTLLLGDRGATLALPARAGRPAAALRMTFPGAAGAAIEGQRRQGGSVSYLSGTDRIAGAPTFGRVGYRGLWPGIDAAFYGDARRLEYDLLVAPGADPGRIRLGFHGHRAMRLGARGDLVLTLPGGHVVRELAPVAYQLVGGRRRPVRSRFVLAANGNGDGGVGIEVGAYDARRRLVIDPVLAYGTYLGGSTSTDEVSDVAVDAAGNAYVTGVTSSPEFTGTAGGYQPAAQGGVDAFVTKINPAGTATVYSTYLGGLGTDRGLGIAVDGAGNAHLSGSTSSSNFPTTAGAPQRVLAGGTSDAFVTTLNPSGTGLVFSTYLGGSAQSIGERAAAVAVDGAGNTYVAGTGAAGLPTTAGSYNPAGSATQGSAFAAKLSPAGALVYSTFIGTVSSSANAIAVGAAGNAYVGGFASPGFPTTPGAYQRTGVSPGFVTELTADGSGLVYSTLLDRGLVYALALDAGGRAYVAGRADSGFVATPGAPRSPSTPGFALGVYDGLFAVLNASGSALDYATYLGGSAGDIAYDVAADASGNAFVVGTTTSTNFVTTSDAQRTTPGTGFLVKLRPGSSGYVYATYFGASGDDLLRGVAVNAAGDAYAGGVASVFGFATPGALKTSNERDDGFVERLDAGPPKTPVVSAAASAGGPAGTTISATATLSGAAGPTGTIAFTLYGPGDAACATPIATSEATVRDNGTFAATGVVAPAPGTYRWVARYSGDPNNAPAAGSCAAPAAAVVVTASAPAAVTGAASAVTASGATLAGTVAPGGLAAAYVFEYGSTLSFGSITTPDDAGSGAADVPVSATLAGLAARTTIYYRLVATSAAGTSFGVVRSLDTGPAGGGAPIVATGVASAATPSSATLTGSVDPAGSDAAFTFEYGTTTSFGAISAVDTTGPGGTGRTVSLPLTGLQPATTYLYRLVATNSNGTSAGEVRSVTTPGVQ